jgi:hypothetical protein
MRRRPFHRRLYFGLVMHGTKLWLSELLAVVCVALLVSGLTAVGVVIGRAQLRSMQLGRQIAALKADRVGMQLELEQLGEQDILVSALRKFVGTRVPEQTIFTLVHLVYKNSRQYGYDPMLVLAVIHVESVFEPLALGRYRSGAVSGAVGLMQIKYETALEVARDLDIVIRSPSDLLKPEINMVLGIAYLTRMISMFNDLKLGILAYNQGPGTIRKTLSENGPLSTQYYQKVLLSYYRLRKLSAPAPFSSSTD